MIDLTSLYKILQTSGFLHNVGIAQLQDLKSLYDMFQNYNGQLDAIPIVWKNVTWKNLERFN